MCPPGRGEAGAPSRTLGYGARMRVAALVLAAGRGERLGRSEPKAFVPLSGRSLLGRSLAVLDDVPEIDLVMPVIPREARALWEATAPERTTLKKLVPPAIGGAERQDSLAAGLAQLPADVDLVAVHDAARPLLQRSDASRVIACARSTGAAILVGPVSDTVKRIRGERIETTLDRSVLRVAQTPQVARTDWLREALAKAVAEGFVATDEAGLLERLGVAVRIVEGDPSNRKITRADDLVFAEAELRRRESSC